MSSIPPLFGRFEVSYRTNKLELTANYKFNSKKDIKSYNISEGIDNHFQTPIIDENAVDDIDKYYGSTSWSAFGLNGRYSVNENFSVQATLTNIFDAHYKEFASGISAPGRNFSIAIQATF
jgi:hemoglobin/transferrin/lactoferrin receptor protein